MSTRAGGIVTIGNGIKLALVVVLAAGTIVLTRRVQQSPEQKVPTQGLALQNGMHEDLKSEGQSVASAPEGVQERSLTRRAEPPRAAGSERARAPRHVARSSHARVEGQGSSPARVLPKGASAVPLNASDDTSKSVVGRPIHPDADGETTASTHASPDRAASVATATKESEGPARDPRAEIAWLERIHAALRAGQNATVLALCAEHEKRWPQGVFAVEREGVRAIAACALQTEDAAARARTYLSAYPRTPLVPRVMAACGELSAVPLTKTK